MTLVQPRVLFCENENEEREFEGDVIAVVFFEAMSA